MRLLNFVQGFSVASDPTQEAAILPVGIPVIRTQFDGSLESLLGASSIVVVNFSDLSQGDMGFRNGVVESQGLLDGPFCLLLRALAKER